MKSYCYDVKKAKKSKYNVSILKILKIIFVPAVLFFLCCFLALKINTIFLLGTLICLIYPIYGALNLVKCNKASLIALVKYDDDALYLIINNNVLGLEGYETLIASYLPGSAIEIGMERNIIKNLFIELMNNENFLKELIEKPTSEKAKGFEIYKIMNIKSVKMNKDSISFSYDGFENSESLLYKEKECKLLNVYNDFDELCDVIKNYKEQDLSSIQIDKKEEKKMRRLFDSNYKKLNNFFIAYICITIINLLSSLILGISSLTFLIVQISIFCLILAHYEATKNTNLDNKKINMILTDTIILFVLNLIFMFLGMEF